MPARCIPIRLLAGYPHVLSCGVGDEMLLNDATAPTWAGWAVADHTRVRRRPRRVPMPLLACTAGWHRPAALPKNNGRNGPAGASFIRHAHRVVLVVPPARAAACSSTLACRSASRNSVRHANARRASRRTETGRRSLRRELVQRGQIRGNVKPNPGGGLGFLNGPSRTAAAGAGPAVRTEQRQVRSMCVNAQSPNHPSLNTTGIIVIANLEHTSKIKSNTASPSLCSAGRRVVTPTLWTFGDTESRFGFRLFLEQITTALTWRRITFNLTREPTQRDGQTQHVLDDRRATNSKDPFRFVRGFPLILFGACRHTHSHPSTIISISCRVAARSVRRGPATVAAASPSPSPCTPLQVGTDRFPPSLPPSA